MFVSGGENVFPPKMENAITNHPAVDEGVLVPVPDEQQGKVAKAVVESKESLELSELRGFLDGRIARYKLPRGIEVVDEIPTSGVSKVDRTAVRERFAEETDR